METQRIVHPNNPQHGCSRRVEMQRHCSASRSGTAGPTDFVFSTAANKVGPRAAQALMRHTDPRLTASVYTDEKLLPLAAELVNVPAIPAGQRASGPAETQPNLDALGASLSASERQALVGMLRRSQVG